jgi:translation initiation factor 2 subunit 2
MTDDELLSLDLTRKKKKKSRPVESAPVVSSFSSELNTDYTYNALLERLYMALAKDRPQLANRSVKHIVQMPIMVREGRKTAFVNFSNLSKDLNRDPEHFKDFILSELSTEGSVDGALRLCLRGRFTPLTMQNIITKYIQQYVQCNSCKSLDTYFNRDNISRLNFLLCNVCESSSSLRPISKGFRAKT